jgi:hypothetical protein
MNCLLPSSPFFRLRVPEPKQQIYHSSITIEEPPRAKSPSPYSASSWPQHWSLEQLAKFSFNTPSEEPRRDLGTADVLKDDCEIVHGPVMQFSLF